MILEFDRMGVGGGVRRRRGALIIGQNNLADARYGAVSGGSSRSTNNADDWVGGLYLSDN